MKKGFWATLRECLTILGPAKARFLMAAIPVSALLTGALPIVASYLPRTVIDLLTEESGRGRVIAAIVILTGLMLVLSALAAALRSCLGIGMQKVRFYELKNLGRRYLTIDYEHLEDPRFLDRTDINMEALQSDGFGLGSIYTGSAAIIGFCISVVAYAVILGFCSPFIFPATAASALLAFLAQRLIGSYVDSRKEERQRAWRQANYFLDTSYDFGSGKEIRGLGIAAKLEEKYGIKLGGYFKIVKAMSRREFAYGLLELLGLLIQDSVSYFLIVWTYLKGMIGLGEVALYIGSVISLSTILRSLAETLPEFVENVDMTKTYFAFKHDASLSGSAGSVAVLKDGPLEIEFCDVSFRYPNSDKNVYTHFNFKIDAGQKLAVVGTNGSGKTTLIKLLTGLFMPDEGKILVNGVSTADMSKEALWALFEVVFQDYTIFAGSVIENVAGADGGPAARERAIECLNRVGLGPKIESLPRGYDTELLKVIEPDGVELSGGQFQKVAIARALYKDARMCILDEPTSALDALAEAEIYRSFDELVKDKTAIYVSHRLSSTRFCDRIALFEEGELKEYGTHDELMAQQGSYYRMFTTQGKYYQEDIGDEKI